MPKLMNTIPNFDVAYWGVPCPACGSKDIWDDETMWGCNSCGRWFPNH